MTQTLGYDTHISKGNISPNKKYELLLNVNIKHGSLS